jgi:hypothetical protein
MLKFRKADTTMTRHQLERYVRRGIVDGDSKLNPAEISVILLKKQGIRYEPAEFMEYTPNIIFLSALIRNGISLPWPFQDDVNASWGVRFNDPDLLIKVSLK